MDGQYEMFLFVLCVLLLAHRGAANEDEGDCKDVYTAAECAELASKNLCTEHPSESYVRANCAATCGACRKTNDCEDLNFRCPDWRLIGLCSNTQLTTFEGVIAKECRKTCGLCKEDEPCRDLFLKEQCSELVELGYCESHEYMMSRQCAESCKFCYHHPPDDFTLALGWSEWGAWSICDVICGDGVRYRSRRCLGGACFGLVTQSGPCTVDQCPKAICQSEKSEYCPYFKELGYCDRPDSVRFMANFCSISCGICEPTESGSGSEVVTSRYKLCVERALKGVVSSTINTLKRPDVSEKEGIIKESRLPIEAQASLRKLSRQGRALTIQDRLFNDIVEQINDLCGVESEGTRGYIESKLLESKVIEISKVDCSSVCTGMRVGDVYRSINGTCNNCLNPLWGSSTTTVLRLLAAQYEDTENSLPRGWAQKLRPVSQELQVPHARLVSQMLLDEVDVRDSRLTLMHFQWGQFLDHDLVLIPTNPDSVEAGGTVNCEKECSNIHPCFPIPLSPTDPIANMTNGKRNCLPFTRSAGIKFNVDGASQYKNQINEVTAFVDGSMVYGSSDFLGLLLKAENGSMRVGSTCPQKNEGPMLPDCPTTTATHFCACDLEACPEKYIAGDTRVNEQPMLTMMHTLWVREHNRIAEHLRGINPCWGAEKVFQESRKVVIGQIQHITYRLYLPVLLGPAGFQSYIGFTSKYNPNIHPGIFNGFSTAAFRFGHSQIPSRVPVVDSNWTVVEEEILHDTFFRANMVCGCGFDNILRGVLSTPVNDVDSHFTNSILNHLFAQHTHDMGLDLTSINVQRGRDHGIPVYSVYRDYCEQKYRVQAKFRNHDETVARIKLVYGDVEKLDLFIGGILEEPINDGLLGPTFSCIIGEQFKNLRDGDRFFYTHAEVFTPDQLREIFKSSLSALSCDNAVSISEVPRRAFIMQDPSEFVKCKELPRINFEKWRDNECSNYA